MKRCRECEEVILKVSALSRDGLMQDSIKPSVSMETNQGLADLIFPCWIVLSISLTVSASKISCKPYGVGGGGRHCSIVPYLIHMVLYLCSLS